MPGRDYYLPDRQMVSQAAQAMIAAPHIPRSTFVGQKLRKTTFDPGRLIPFHWDEVYPGDDMSYRISAYVRMATPLFPLFSNFKIETFAFFIADRLTWVNFTKMMGEQDSAGDSIAFTEPTLTSPAGGGIVGDIHDHMGIPPAGQITAGQTVEVCARPFRAYNRVWNEWFRDENSLAAALQTNGNSGADTWANYVILRRAKSADIFTRALPWPQKFTSPAALGTAAPIANLGVLSPAANAAGALLQGVITPTQIGGLFTPAFMSTGLYAAADAAGNTPLNVYADLSAISVNTLRLSFLVQELLERDARGGTRYVELIKSHFGVTSPDARLQRTEYIGGGSSPLSLTPIAQTAPVAGVGLGALGAAGSGFGQHGGRFAATEHGIILWLINVQSELLYQQGIRREFMRRTRFDRYWPSLAGLGEQALLRQEIFATGVNVDDETVFGYVPRYDELRQMYSDASGLFRSTSAGNIDEWHTGQQFVGAPVLGATFLQDDPPMTRVLAAASTGMQFIADIMIERTATRAMPVHGTPQTLGSF